VGRAAGRDTVWLPRRLRMDPCSLVVRRELLAWTAEEGWPLADKRTAKVVVQGAEPEVLRWRLDRLGLPRLDAARNRHW